MLVLRKRRLSLFAHTPHNRSGSLYYDLATLPQGDAMLRPTIRVSHCIAAIAIPLIAASTTRAAELASNASEVHLTMVGGHYAVANAQFNDLAGVDAWLGTRNVRVVAIDRCASTNAPQLLASGSIPLRQVYWKSARCPRKRRNVHTTPRRRPRADG